jgi:urease accessory protein
MNRAALIVRRLAVKPERVADTITLDHQARHRRRMTMTADNGLEFLLDLGAAAILEDGDALKLDDGRLVQVLAADEDLIEITTENPLRLMKLAWHLGNRHVPAEINADALYIAPDHVLVEMVRGLGGKAEPVKRPFRPERGAYHEHAEPARDVMHVHGHGVHEHHEHEHGEQCGCGHDHHH